MRLLTLVTTFAVFAPTAAGAVEPDAYGNRWGCDLYRLGGTVAVLHAGRDDDPPNPDPGEKPLVITDREVFTRDIGCRVLERSEPTMRLDCYFLDYRWEAFGFLLPDRKGGADRKDGLFVLASMYPRIDGSRYLESWSVRIEAC